MHGSQLFLTTLVLYGINTSIIGPFYALKPTIPYAIKNQLVAWVYMFYSPILNSLILEIIHVTALGWIQPVLGLQGPGCPDVDELS